MIHCAWSSISFRSYDPTEWSFEKRRSTPAYVKLTTNASHWPDNACKRFAQEIDQVVCKAFQRRSIEYQYSDAQAERARLTVPVDVTATHFPPMERASMQSPQRRRLLFAAHCESGGDRSAYAVLSYLLSRCYPAVHPTGAYQLLESARFYTVNAHESNRWALDVHGWPTLQKQFAQRDHTEMISSMKRADIARASAHSTAQASAQSKPIKSSLKPPLAAARADGTQASHPLQAVVSSRGTLPAAAAAAGGQSFSASSSSAHPVVVPRDPRMRAPPAVGAHGASNGSAPPGAAAGLAPSHASSSASAPAPAPVLMSDDGDQQTAASARSGVSSEQEQELTLKRMDDEEKTSLAQKADAGQLHQRRDIGQWR